MRRLAFVALAAFALAAPASASEQHPNLAELEGEVMCPVCGTTLDQSDSPAAQQIKGLIVRRIAAGDTKSEIKELLVREYGQAILAAPRHSGFGLLAWWVPLGGILLAAMLVGYAAWRWARARENVRAAGPSLDPAVERRLDDELARFE